MTDLAQPRPLSFFQKQRITENLNKMISDTPYNRDFKERVLKSMLGEYTEEDVKRVDEEQNYLLEQLEKEMEIKECIPATESKVFFGLASQQQISDKYIEIEDAKTGIV